MDRLADSGIMQVLGGLPKGFREVIYLADVEGYSYAEIAEILDVPKGTVMSRIHRGRKKLRAAPARLPLPSLGPRPTI